MSVVKQLYQLQEVDLELESNERMISQITRQLGDNQAVIEARSKLAREQQRLDDLKRQQRSVEVEVTDLTSKLTAAEKELYSGKIHNPKELTNLQHEIDGLKVKRQHLEDSVLEIMDGVEVSTRNTATLSSGLKVQETEWQSRQQILSASLEQHKTVVSNLKHKRELLIAEIDIKLFEVYSELKKQKGIAVARVEQGVCRACRISLSVSELQQVRGGHPVRCSSCGRILFLA
ncbi:MAG: hypothetical protein HYY41_02415 [Chloroflexi bacterium]|nr:hypothetical protein [Chloroflexota bacterium]